MAQFINSLESGSSAITPGERRFGSRLRELLEDDYLCWYNVPVGHARQYPDFVVLHPGQGLLIFEVKDWKLDTIRAIGKQSVEIVTPEGALKTQPNPLDQARGYCMTIVNLLSADPQLQDPSQRYRGKICFPYGYGVVFTNITRRQLDEVLTPDDQDLVLPARLVICKDEMSESTEADRFQERLWGMFHYSFGQTLSLPQIERVRWHLFPEIRISSIQQDFFSSPAPETAEIAETVPEIVRVMDIAQEQLARSLGSGHRVIHGVAGSGKTLILGYRCLHLAQFLHKPILVLCFNITLAARLRSFIKERGIAEKVQVYHFHEWCKLQLSTYHADLIPSKKMIFDQQVDSVIHGVETGFIPRAQYGAIMIDEGHDFEPEWLKLIAQMTDPADDSLLLLYDDAQSIYRKSNGLNFSLSSVGIKAQVRTTILRLNYRNTREILAFAYDFASIFLEPIHADEDHIPLIKPEAAGVSGPHPAFRRQPSLQAEVEYAVQCIKKWNRAGTPLSEVAVLYLNNDHGRLVAEQLKLNGIDHLLAVGSKNKQAYDPRLQQVTIVSAQSSKGLEFGAVIIIGVGHLQDEKQAAADARLLYVGMTRAKEKLLLTTSENNHFTEKLSALAA
ncbi:nuclease-related domain-containing DEAD/DEAH box helicase [soil metagenome]